MVESKEGLWQLIRKTPPREILLILGLFTWFFLVICSYYVIRPVRTALVLYDFGAENLPWVYMGTGLAAGLAAYLFSKFSKVKRSRLISGVQVFFILNLLFWWWVAGQSAASQAAGQGGWVWAAPSFYVWTDVFSIMGVTIFWMYANDVLGHNGAKKAFGVLTAAGMSGGAAGAWITKVFVEDLGPVDILLVASAIYALTLVLFAGLEYLSQGRSAVRSQDQQKQGADLRKLPEVIRQVKATRLLWLIAVVVCLERIAPDMVDYVFQNTAKGFFEDKTSYSAFFANFEMWRNLIVLAGTLVITPLLLTYLGPGAAMVSVPLAITVFGAAMLFFPSLMVVVLLKGFEEGQRHAWFKAGKETLYTVTSREILYTVKGYIEMFLYRFSRGIAGLFLLGLGALMGLVGLTESVTMAVLIVMLPLCILWAWAIWQVDKEYKRKLVD